jgi:hypothetical protein
VQLNGSRKVIGVLRGYDVFLNIVLDDAVEEKEGGEKVRVGTVVIRGNSVVMLEVGLILLLTKSMVFWTTDSCAGPGEDKLDGREVGCWRMIKRTYGGIMLQLSGS